MSSEVKKMKFTEWLRNRRFAEGASPEAPTKPITTPSRPKPKPDKPVPWLPTKPDRLPKAKDEDEDEDDYKPKKKRIVREVYERDVKPYVKNFFSGLIRGGDRTPMHSNPLTAMHGERLVKKYYDEIRPKYDEHQFPISDAVLHQLFGLLNQIQSIEAQHREELKQEAIRLVSEHTGIPEEFFKAFLNEEMEGGSSYKKAQDENNDEDTVPITPEIKQHIDRMTNFNILTQGHSLGTMDKLHFKIKEILDNIDPRLSNLYKKVSIGIQGNYFFTNMAELFQQAFNRKAGAIGEEEIRKDEDGTARVYAKGKCFPVLVQELLKGAMDLVTSHAHEGLPDDVINTIKKHTDARYQDEPFHFLLGPPLWKEFLKMVPPQYRQGEKMMQVIMQLARKDPKFVNDEIRKALEELQATNDTTTIHRIITELMEELEDHDEDNDEEEPFDINLP